MPRILITGFSALPGPNRPGVQMQHIVHALTRHHTVDVLVQRHAEQAYVERQGNARILRVPISEEDLHGQVEAFRRALKRQLDGADYDIVHFRDGWTGMLILEMQEQLEYATVFDATRAPIAELPLLNLELAAELGGYEEACLARADLVLVANEGARERVVQSLGASEHVFVVPPGVDVDRFDWDDSPDGQPVVLYAGTIAPGRGVRVLLRSMVYVTRELDARLVVAGHIDARFRASLEHAIAELGLNGRVDLVGEVEHGEMAALIARAQVCVAPAAPDGRAQPQGLFPTKLLEYMACKRAVVAPTRSTAESLIEHGVHGLLFNPGDPADLSMQIVKLLGQPELRGELAAAAYQLVRREYTAASTRRGLRKAYDYLIALAPWGEKLSDILDEPSHPSRAVGPEDLSDSLSDNTDEYEPPFSMRASLGSGDVTTIDPRIKHSLDASPLDAGSWELTSIDAAPRQHDAGLDSSDDWVVVEQPMAGEKESRVWDEEGTPVDVAAAPAAEESLDEIIENRFVSGEVEVAESPARPRMPEEDPSFTAVSSLLGSPGDDTDGIGKAALPEGNEQGRPFGGRDKPG